MPCGGPKITLRANALVVAGAVVEGISLRLAEIVQCLDAILDGSSPPRVVPLLLTEIIRHSRYRFRLEETHSLLLGS
jgi:hypothetical protein